MRVPAHRTERLTARQRGVLDLLAYARRVPVVHGLLEVDVERARTLLAKRGSGVTFTTFVVASVGRAVSASPHVNARRAGRRMVRFDDVDVVVTAEHRIDGMVVPLPHVLRDVDHRSLDDMAAELRLVRRRAEGNAATPRTRTALERMPGVARRSGLRAAVRMPAVAARLGPAIGVSSLGMFGAGIAWGLPVSPLTLMVTVGSIGGRPMPDGRDFRSRDTLALTLSFDHTVVDGAPAARFASDLRSLLEDATVLR